MPEYKIETTYHSNGTSTSTVREAGRPSEAAMAAADAIIRLEKIRAAKAAEIAAKTEAEKQAAYERAKSTVEIYPKTSYYDRWQKPSFENLPNYSPLIRQTHKTMIHLKSQNELHSRNVFILRSIILNIIFLGAFIGFYYLGIAINSGSDFELSVAAYTWTIVSIIVSIAILIFEILLIKLRLKKCEKNIENKKQEQIAALQDVLLACFEAERTNEQYKNAYGTDWTRNNPIPEDSSTWYDWEMRRRKEDKEFFDCTTNTEWARQNPEQCKYSYMKSLDGYNIYGDLYGHLLWLKKRIAEDTEFNEIKHTLKPSVFFLFIQRDDWLDSASFIQEEKDRKKKEENDKRLAEEQAKAEKEALYREYQSLSKK